MKGSHHLPSLSVTKERFKESRKKQHKINTSYLKRGKMKPPHSKDNEFRRKSSGKHLEIESARLSDYDNSNSTK